MKKYTTLGLAFCDPKGEDYTHNITTFYYDQFTGLIKITVNKGLNVNSFTVTAEEAMFSGLINLSVLEKYLK